MAAIIASLIFVGLQLKQAQDIAIASQYQARSDALREQFSAFLESDAATRVIGRDLLADMQASERVSPEIKAWAAAQPVEELAFRAVGAYVTLKSHDNLFFQYESGFLSEDAWAPIRVPLRQSLEDPRTWTRGMYEDNPEIWRKSFRNLVEGMLR